MCSNGQHKIKITKEYTFKTKSKKGKINKEC